MVTKLRNEITNFRQRPNESLFEAWECYKLSIDRLPNHNMLPVTQIDTFYNGLTLRHRDTINAATALKAKMAEINKNLMKVLQINQQVKAVTPNCETCGGPHSYNDCLATIGQTQNVYAAGAYQGGNSYQPQDLKGITTRSGNEYKGPTIPTTSFSLPQVVERETEVTKDTVPPTINRSTKDVQPLVVQTKTLNSKPVVAPVLKPVVAPVSASKPNPKPSIPYPSRIHDQKLRDKANDQKEKFFQIFQDLNFNISFADALILMPKFGPTIKSLLTNKDKLYELARAPPNEHCSAVLLKKLPEKLGDPDKFLIPCDFPGMDECLALADLGASINLMPLSVWNKLSLSELTPTLMNLELADRSISRPIGVAEDVFVKTERSLIDVYAGELTLRVNNEAVIFNLDQTSRYSANYNDMTANQIDVIDMACEEYSQEVFGFSNVIASGNPTPYYDLIIFTSSPTLTPFGDSDFLLEEVDAFLALEDDPTSPEVDHSYYDIEGDILLLEAFLNDDSSLPHPTQGMYLPQIQKELKFYKAKNDKSSIDEPPEVELKDLPPHLEYAFLKGNDKLPVIIAKDLSIKEKAALIKVLKSHKQAIAWKLFDIKGINPEFYTHKILMEDDFEPAVQHQRRVNPKIHEIIKKEVLKLLDTELIYPISDSPWVSPVHCVSKKGGFTVVENEENELIPTRLVTGWHVCIDYYQEKTTFTCPHGTFAFHRMPFGLCNAPGTFQRCIMAIFHDMIEKTMEVFMDDFSVFGNSFETCLSHLDKMLQRCEDTNLCLNWEKSHFMVKRASSSTIRSPRMGLRKPLTFSRLATMDPLGDIMARTTPPKRCLPLDFIGPQSTVMPTTWSYLVTLVNVRERFRNEMKCLKIPSKFVKFLTFGASISWGRSPLHEGTSIYSWPTITCRNRLKRKRSPPTTPELFVNF
nr:reverse transcriptase domain-containing protein [Tanacetum cinerariifolium]